jgi:NADH-quinone oxidoreductase subunit M
VNLLYLPWLEVALALSLVGAGIVSRIRTPLVAYRFGLVCSGGVFLCTFLAWLSFYAGIPAYETYRRGVQPYLFGRPLLLLDELGAPMVPAVALLHFLTALATARTKMRRFSLSWSLAAEALRLATFSCRDPWLLIGLLTLSVLPPYIELRSRRRPTRVYVLHMALFVALLVSGWIGVQAAAPGTPAPAWAVLFLLAGTLVRSGTVPAHCWVTDWFEHASFGNALLFVTPLPGVYAALHLVLPIAPDWVLRALGIVSLTTAVYAAGMAIVQREARRFFAYLFLSQASLVLLGLELVGLEQHAEIALTGALCLWFSAILSLGGFGLTLRAIEARFGRLALVEYHGLYEHSPALAVCFLLTGLATVGFPGTLGFISAELLVDGAVIANVYIAIGVVAAAALNGIAVVRAYLLLFTGTRHVSTVSLGIGSRERIAVLTFAALVLGGGLYPQPGVETRFRAAQEILRARSLHPYVFDEASEDAATQTH